MYNLTNLTGGDPGFLNSMSVANDVTNGLFWVLISVILWIVLVTTMQKSGILPAITAASFVTSIVGMLLILTGLVSQGYLIFYIIVMASAVAAAFVAGKGEG